ncbi:MAG TPA: 16S rRNA (guanine(527)-N(7))-methyltransferase RsmG [Xanthobacteraceae bacterium]|nr:16S rRNA (guanine(527)-N(7))-methyltransferase RsmG [Xanthobacteraceae bacterium]
MNLRVDRDRALRLTPISTETAKRLDTFVALLLQWQAKINLVAPSTIEDIWTRHIADSLQLIALAPTAKIWIDLGSGAGFPGLVVACALADDKDVCVHLVESNGKKAAFLREAVRVLEVPAVVHARRIEDFVASFTEPVDVVTARALAPLDELLDLAAPLWKTGAKGLFLKGQDVEAELTEASKCWTINSTLVPSKTNQHGRIVVIQSAIKRAKQ